MSLLLDALKKAEDRKQGGAGRPAAGHQIRPAPTEEIPGLVLEPMSGEVPEGQADSFGPHDAGASETPAGPGAPAAPATQATQAAQAVQVADPSVTVIAPVDAPDVDALAADSAAPSMPPESGVATGATTVGATAGSRSAMDPATRPLVELEAELQAALALAPLDKTPVTDFPPLPPANQPERDAAAQATPTSAAVPAFLIAAPQTAAEGGMHDAPATTARVQPRIAVAPVAVTASAAQAPSAAPSAASTTSGRAATSASKPHATGAAPQAQRSRTQRVLGATRPTVAGPRRASRNVVLLGAVALVLALGVAGALWWLSMDGGSSVMVSQPAPAPMPAPAPLPAPTSQAGPDPAPPVPPASSTPAPTVPTAASSPAAGPGAQAARSESTAGPAAAAVQARRAPVVRERGAVRVLPVAPMAAIAAAAGGAAEAPATSPQARAPTAATPAGATADSNDLRLQPGSLSRTPPIDEQLSLGYQSLRQGQLDRADRHYREALRMDPRNRDALLGMATVELRRGRGEQAGELYRAMLQLNPRDADAAAGLSLIGGQDPQAAESVLKRMAAEMPDSALVQFALGTLHARQQRWAAAQEAFFRTVTLAPGEADHHYNLAVSLEHLHQPRAALASYERALALMGQSSAQFDAAAARARVAALRGALEPPRSP